MKIEKICARQIFDSRGTPTLECQMLLEEGICVSASVPSGASRGKHEAFELRDSGSKQFGGMAVVGAVEKLNTIIAPLLIGREPNVSEIDELLIAIDGTENKSFLGANTILAVSLAVARAQAAAEEIELLELFAHISGSKKVEMPRPWFNVLNGGAHANNGLLIQEFIVIPTQSDSFAESFYEGLLFYQTLKSVLHERGLSSAVGDEGGFAPRLANEWDAFLLLAQTLERLDATRYQFAIDAAASQFYDPTTNTYRWHEKSYQARDLIEYYVELADRIPLAAIEDGLAEDDWIGWQELTAALGDRLLIVGDDLFVTNTARIAQGIAQNAANSVVIKPNQIGTVSETLAAIQLCKSEGLQTVLSHRSGETEDNWLADLAVGASTGNIKAGGCSRSERMAKYNQLLRIEAFLAHRFAGG